MKRDNDYIRELLAEMESAETFFTSSFTDKDDEPARDKRHYHILLMCDSGLMTPFGGHTFRITNSGHDFLEATRDEGIWKKTKDAVAQTGGNATLEIVKQIAVGFLKKSISDKTGIDL